MSRNDWIALGVIVVASYFVLKAKGAGSAPLSLSVHYDPQAGWIDDTQGVQYDEQSGNLYDAWNGSVLIGTVASGLDGSVFVQPNVQAMIAAARQTAAVAG